MRYVIPQVSRLDLGLTVILTIKMNTTQNGGKPKPVRFGKTVLRGALIQDTCFWLHRK